MYDLPDNWQHRDILQAIKADTRKGCAIDIGAHRGILTRVLLQHYPQVVAVEPTALVKEIPAEAHCHRVALGLSSGRVGLRAGTDNTGQTHVVPGDDVALAALDDLCNEHGYAPTFLKIDVEGMERDVLLGGEMVIREHRPVIMVEENGLGTRYGNPLGTVDTLLTSWGARRIAVLHQWRVGADYLYTW